MKSQSLYFVFYSFIIYHIIQYFLTIFCLEKYFDKSLITALKTNDVYRKEVYSFAKFLTINAFLSWIFGVVPFILLIIIIKLNVKLHLMGIVYVIFTRSLPIINNITYFIMIKDNSEILFNVVKNFQKK
uniref:G_PROTEIN_RECEP_F1_2 domain-containing protein n=1 Tax=Strongyloides stercoralis TaxID=6248 RepID=A0A0K0E5J4_STRER